MEKPSLIEKYRMNKKKEFYSKNISELNTTRLNIRCALALLALSLIIPAICFLDPTKFGTIAGLSFITAQLIGAGVLLSEDKKAKKRIERLELISSVDKKDKKETAKENTKTIQKEAVVQENIEKSFVSAFDKLSREDQIKVLKACRESMLDPVVNEQKEPQKVAVRKKGF